MSFRVVVAGCRSLMGDMLDDADEAQALARAGFGIDPENVIRLQRPP